MKVTFYSSTYRASNSDGCCDNLWVIIDIVDNMDTCLDVRNYYTNSNEHGNTSLPFEHLMQHSNGVSSGPSVTFRMHPSAVPDTRNTEYVFFVSS